jgi:hypothetical protein
MSKDILWIAMRDGTGWASSRTRDLTDVAFTVHKPNSSGDVIIHVRKPNRDDDPTSRATQVVGLMHFESVDDAKASIIKQLSIANSYPDQVSARDALLQGLLAKSIAHKGSYAYLSTGKVSQTATTWVSTSTTVSEELKEEALAVATPRVQAWMDMVSTLNDAFDMDKAIEAMETAVEEPTNPFIIEGLGDALDVPMHPFTEQVVNEVAEAIADDPAANELLADIKEAFSILNNAEVIQEVVTPVFNPDTWTPGDDYPSEYMVIGNRLIKMEWPK